MLYLNPPYVTFQGTVIGGDYSDPLQFWYFPGRPRIAVDDGKPAIRFLIYKDIAQVNDEDETVGFLFFDTVLALPDPVAFEKAAAQHLKQALQLEGTVRVAPLQYRSGTVKLIFLDRKSGGPGPAPGEEVRDDLVTVVESAGQPSLYGENRAIFSVGLTKKATTLLLGSFDGFIPAGVIYELHYIAMQRAFGVKVEVDWEELYDYVREYQEDRFFFYSDEAEKIVRHLESTKTIRFTSAIEGIGEEGMQGEYEEVRKTLTAYVFEKFFEPKINSQELLDGNTARNVLGFLGGLRDETLPMNFGCSKRELQDRQDRSLDIDYSVTRAVERQIAPQAHLSLFWDELGLAKDDVITVVDSEKSMWETTSLRVLATAEFGDASVAQILVDVAYGPSVDGEPAPGTRIRTVVLDQEHRDETIDHWYDPAIGRTVLYRFTVAFGPRAVVGDGVLLTSPWREATTAVVPVNALELYTERSVEFQLSKLLSKDMFPEVLAHIRYTAPDGGWTFQDSRLLVVDGTTTWKPTFRVPRGQAGVTEYRLEFVREHAAPIDSGWRTTSEPTVVALDPRENLYPVRVMVAGDRSQLEQILVDLEYTDTEAGVHESTSFFITKGSVDTAREWAFPRAALERTRYRYSQVVIDVDGNVTQPGWVQSDAPVLLVGKVFASKWKIVPQVVGPPLSENNLARIVVSIDYDDEDNDYHAHTEQTFAAPGEGAPFELELKNPNHRSYAYRVRYVLSSGFEKKVGPISRSDTFLVISSIPPAD
ncbi:MAG TPA: hypothetical protein PKE40_03990 [Arachnia sp.]|nr:hypothetical protein [Arachnia sp.]HMT85492.1 hypothetical protein [Arachnia sp.]